MTTAPAKTWIDLWSSDLFSAKSLLVSCPEHWTLKENCVVPSAMVWRSRRRNPADPFVTFADPFGTYVVPEEVPGQFEAGERWRTWHHDVSWHISTQTVARDHTEASKRSGERPWTLRRIGVFQTREARRDGGGPDAQANALFLQLFSQEAESAREAFVGR